MSILDDAIRQHLELKRAHGADEGELKKLEDEAFGPPQRPDEVDPFAEAPTEFLLSPTDGVADLPEIGDEESRSGRRPNITDLQEAPPADAPFDIDAPPPPSPEDAAPPVAGDDLAPTPDAPPPSPADAADAPLPPPPGEAPPAPEDAAPAASEDVAPPAPEVEAPAAEIASSAEEVDSPAVEEHPAGEHEIVPDAGPSTDERHAIADQPTQMFDVQAAMEAEGAPPAPPAEEASPSDEELVDAVQGEPQAAPPAPEDPAAAALPPAEIDEQEPLDPRGPDAEVAGHPPTEEESAEFDFFNEQRLSDELDQALEAPLPPTDEHVAMPQYDDASAAPPAQGAIFDFEESAGSSDEDEEDPAEEAPVPEPPSEELEPASEEIEPPSEEAPRAAAEPPSEEKDYAFDPDTGHEDVLEDKPKFLDDPDDDDLWFEQKPPKDFDLD